MTPITFWFDVVSPYAWLAFDRLPQALEGCSYVVEYRPVLFAGLLKRWGQKGPAEIGPKRAWTYRQVAWLAHQQGCTLQLPRPHPFNPLALQRLAVAASADGRPNRRVVELLFRAGAPARDPGGDDVKADLRAATDAALDAGIFGVPTLVADGRAFWGQDGLPMLRSALQGEAWFQGRAWDEAGAQPAGVQRST
jgi:2-hydroxychromene-2-carboxylate isomerase